MVHASDWLGYGWNLGSTRSSLCTLSDEIYLEQDNIFYHSVHCGRVEYILTSLEPTAAHKYLHRNANTAECFVTLGKIRFMLATISTTGLGCSHRFDYLSYAIHIWPLMKFTVTIQMSIWHQVESWYLLTDCQTVRYQQGKKFVIKLWKMSWFYLPTF